MGGVWGAERAERADPPRLEPGPWQPRNRKSGGRGPRGGCAGARRRGQKPVKRVVFARRNSPAGFAERPKPTPTRSLQESVRTAEALHAPEGRGDPRPRPRVRANGAKEKSKNTPVRDQHLFLDWHLVPLWSPRAGRGLLGIEAPWAQGQNRSWGIGWWAYRAGDAGGRRRPQP